MADPATWAAIGTAVVGAGTSAYQASQQRDSQDQAMQSQENQAKRDAFAQDQALNAANKKSTKRDQALMLNQALSVLGTSGTNITKGAAAIGGQQLGGSNLLGR